jgi:hypothetical protein
MHTIDQLTNSVILSEQVHTAEAGSSHSLRPSGLSDPHSATPNILFSRPV